MDPPTAMENAEGILLTEHVEIQNESLKYFEKLFEDTPMNKDYMEIQKWNENLCKLRLSECAENKTEEWTLTDLELALKQLKNGTSRDPYGYNNELFKKAGKDLKSSILNIMNKVKNQQKVPKCMQLCNITTIFKNKGPRRKYSSYRGIYRITALNIILDRFIFNDMYATMQWIANLVTAV